MKNKEIVLSFVVLLAFALNEANADIDVVINKDPTVLRGIMPAGSEPDLEKNISATWKFVKSNAGFKTAVEAPVINLEPFLFAKESDSWVKWEKGWIATHPEIWDDWNNYKVANPSAQLQEEGNPFTDQLRGYHYVDSVNIQVNPILTFLAPKSDIAGWGYYSVGHEMHHYALEKLGIPMRLHHCLFIQDRSNGRAPLMSDLADFLVENSISSVTVRLFGGPMQMEYISEPCQSLSADDLGLVQKYKDML